MPRCRDYYNRIGHFIFAFAMQYSHVGMVFCELKYNGQAKPNIISSLDKQKFFARNAELTKYRALLYEDQRKIYYLSSKNESYSTYKGGLGNLWKIKKCRWKNQIPGVKPIWDSDSRETILHGRAPRVSIDGSIRLPQHAPDSLFRLSPPVAIFIKQGSKTIYENLLLFS